MTSRKAAALANITRADVLRFMDKINFGLFCWEWTGGTNPKGYGVFSVGRVCVVAHRVAYHIYHGGIPDGKQILHSCDNPRCVRKTHIRAGTHGDNMGDKVTRNRQASKITREMAIDALASYYAGDLQRDIGARFGIDQSTVSDIVRGRSWGHL